LLLAAAVLALSLLSPRPAAAQLLDGEFGDVDLGRELIEPGRFPTIRELRRAVARDEIGHVLMLRLYSSGDNHYLPVFSGDGLRLAFQRSDVQGTSSKLLVFPTLASAEPAMLSDEAEAYDYMFRWGVNAPESFAFVRIRPGEDRTQILFSESGVRPVEKVPGRARSLYPALYRRTDGIWRLVYEEGGRLVHEAWDAAGPVGDPIALDRATAARWAGDGYRLLVIRPRSPGTAGGPGDVVVRNLRTEEDVVLPAGEATAVRSPTWSPDETRAAFYVREGGEGRPWQIRVAGVDGGAGGPTIGRDVVVNDNFDSQGPAWQPDGRRVWFFSREHQRQAYYPLVAGDAAGGGLTVVDYPNRCTTPNDLAINTANPVPEMAFVAHEGRPKDLFILFLNHY
jgi:hypothetical protein